MLKQLLPSANKAQGGLWFPTVPLVIGVTAVSFSSIMIAVCTAPAGSIGMYRLAISVVLLLPFAAREWRAVLRISRVDALRMLASGVFLGLHFLFWIASLKHTSIASSMIITALQPAFTAAGAAAFLGERFSRGQFTSMVMALLGIVAIAVGDAGTSGSLYGDLLSLFGTIAISGYMLVGQTVRRVTSSTTYNTIVFAIAAMVLFMVGLINRTPMTGFRRIDWLWLILLAIIPTLFGHALFNWLLYYVSASRLSMVVLGEPIGAIVLAALFLHRSITLLQGLGGVITLLAVWLFLHVSRSFAKSAIEA